MRSDNSNWFVGGVAVCGLVLALGCWPGTCGAQTDDLDVEVAQGNRRLDVTWPATPEVGDPLFGGYNVWRSEIPAPWHFDLMRRFQRRYPVTWTYCTDAPFPDCGPVTAATERRFVDPDSIVTLTKIEISAQGDSALIREYIDIPPHNGFPYYYAVTWFDECISERNDTLRVHMPQPEVFEFQRGGETLHGVLDYNGDTLLVVPSECFRIDRDTNGPTGDLITVYQGTAETDSLLLYHAIEETRSREPTFPTTVAQPSLRSARAIPNPYEISAFWDEPDRRKVQFINLTDRAKVSVFTLGGDLVRELPHPAPGSASGLGSVDWDLKNADGRLVDPGIYIYHVESPDHVVEKQGRLIIIY